MRVAIFVAVVAAHVVVILLLISWRLLPPEYGRESSIAAILLPPLNSDASSPAEEDGLQWPSSLLYGGARPNAQAHMQHGPETGQSGKPQKRSILARPRAPLNVPQPSQSSATTVDSEPATGPSAPPPDWRAQAEIAAETVSQRIVAKGDAAEHQAHALMQRVKPARPDRAASPQFEWDFASTHRLMPAPGGGFVYNINDHCQVLIFIIPFAGCSIGKIEANGHLFDHLHDPVKFGDWDWRTKDP